jgi:peptide/nickel transport system permease protein
VAGAIKLSIESFDHEYLMYLIKRILQGLLSIVGASIVIFVISRLSGDPIAMLLPVEAPPSLIEQTRRDMGLDRSYFEQYVIFARHAIGGDFGQSYRWQMPALELVMQRLPATIELALAALLFSVVIAVPFGVLSAVRRGSWIDRFGNVFAMLGQAMPGFWVGLLLVYFFAIQLNWLPAFGRGTFAQLIMPAIALGWYPVAAQTRVVRSAMLDVLDRDYIRVARALGVPENVVIWKYGLRNALVPLITIMGVYFASMLSGAFIIEVVFAWPGLGRTVVEAVFARDFPVVQAGVLITSILFVTSNLLVDLSYHYIDPRIRHGH